MNSLIPIGLTLALLFTPMGMMAQGKSKGVKCNDCQSFHQCMNSAKATYDARVREINKTWQKQYKICIDKYGNAASVGFIICMKPHDLLRSSRLAVAFVSWRNAQIVCCWNHKSESFNCPGYWSRCFLTG